MTTLPAAHAVAGAYQPQPTIAYRAAAVMGAPGVGPYPYPPRFMNPGEASAAAAAAARQGVWERPEARSVYPDPEACAHVQRAGRPAPPKGDGNE